MFRLCMKSPLLLVYEYKKEKKSDLLNEDVLWVAHLKCA